LVLLVEKQHKGLRRQNSLNCLTQNSDTTESSDRELHRLQFSLQAASPENFGYTLIRMALYNLLKMCLNENLSV